MVPTDPWRRPLQIFAHRRHAGAQTSAEEPQLELQRTFFGPHGWTDLESVAAMACMRFVDGSHALHISIALFSRYFHGNHEPASTHFGKISSGQRLF